MNRRQQILIISVIIGIGIVAILAGIIMYINAGVPTMTTVAEPIPGEKSPALISGYPLIISTVDLSTGEPLGSASVYLDGGYEGSTSALGMIGIQNISPVFEGQHTIRVTKSGYMDYSQSIAVPSDSLVKIGLQSHPLVTIQEIRSHDTNIDIVFVPSATTYNCAEQKIISPTLYVTDRSAFVTDVNRVIEESLFSLDSVTDKTDPLPADYRERFNLYYYYDPARFGDAFSGCAGTVPENLWKTVSFADIVVILYPTYYTLDTGEPCEPIACVNPGTGRRWMKIPADQNTLFLHESGHAIFGLIDTYCGNTKYWQNDPDPNVWLSQENCVRDATNNSWDASACLQIQQKNPTACIKQFWRWDPDPDIMHEGYFGTFGQASTRRITYTFNNFNTWGNTP
jgi:hypothetical protein